MSFSKWIGAALGWSFGGPIGAIIGMALGGVVDGFSKGGGGTFTQETYQKRPRTQSGDFEVELIGFIINCHKGLMGNKTSVN